MIKFKKLRLFYDMEIRYKLILSYFIVALLPILGIGFFSYSSSTTYLREQSISVMSQAQQQLISDITGRLNRYTYLADTVYYNPTIRDFVIGEYISGYEERDILYNYVEKLVPPLLESTGKSIYMGLVRYGSSHNESIQSNFDNILDVATETPDLLARGSRFYNIFNSSSLEGRKWFEEIKGKAREYKWMQVEEDKKFNNISVFREIMNHTGKNSTEVGMVKITVKLQDLLSDTEETGSEGEGKKHEKGYYNLIFDEKGRLISFSTEEVEFYKNNTAGIMELLQGSSDNASKIFNNMLYIKGSIRANGWKILSIYPVEKLEVNVSRMRTLTILYCAAALVILLMVTYMLSASFSKRITRIARYMNNFYKGDTTGTIHDDHKDELGYLTEAYNDMAGRINTLIEDNYKANIDKKDAQLKVLQAQINPHFLYNSLSCISRLSDFGESEKINQIVESLTKFYRMTLNKGKEIISISDELTQIKSYLDIYKIRKGEYFDTVFEIDENVLNYDTIKVILQPFVENIFEHGFYRRRHVLTIKVLMQFEGGNIVFKIIDDGIGINKDKQAALLSQDSTEGNGYGIKNVNQRIKMYFGENYGVSIFSRIGIGTTVKITIPKYKLQDNCSG